MLSTTGSAAGLIGGDKGRPTFDDSVANTLDLHNPSQVRIHRLQYGARQIPGRLRLLIIIVKRHGSDDAAPCIAQGPT